MTCVSTPHQNVDRSANQALPLFCKFMFVTARTLVPGTLSCAEKRNANDAQQNIAMLLPEIRPKTIRSAHAQ